MMKPDMDTQRREGIVLIEVKDLAKRYQNKAVLSGLSLKVDKGQTVALLGVKGAGKTTALDLISGSMEMCDGEVSICGHSMRQQEGEAKSRLGYMPEQPPLYREMTVRGYLKFVCDAKLMSHKAVSTEISRVLQLTGLTDVADQVINGLSDGVKRLVSLAQALIDNPDVLLLDEPTLGLDPKEMITLRTLIRDLKKDHAILIASDNLTEVLHLCDRVLVLREGIIVSRGAADELSKLSMDSGYLALKVKAGEAELKSALSGIQIETLCSTDEPGVLGLTAGNLPDVREKIFRALAKADLPIMYMAPVPESLDDLLMKLTNERFSEARMQEGESGNESGL